MSSELPHKTKGITVLTRFILLAIGLPLMVTGLSLTFTGIFAFIGIPLLVVGLGCVSAAVDSST